ncbi:hypothetical protein JCM8547_004856 [Rhodosporidiobolus lusitaniae]
MDPTEFPKKPKLIIPRSLLVPPAKDCFSKLPHEVLHIIYEDAFGTRLADVYRSNPELALLVKEVDIEEAASQRDSRSVLRILESLSPALTSLELYCTSRLTNFTKLLSALETPSSITSLALLTPPGEEGFEETDDLTSPLSRFTSLEGEVPLFSPSLFSFFATIPLHTLSYGITLPRPEPADPPLLPLTRLLNGRGASSVPDSELLELAFPSMWWDEDTTIERVLAVVEAAKKARVELSCHPAYLNEYEDRLATVRRMLEAVEAAEEKEREEKAE